MSLTDVIRWIHLSINKHMQNRSDGKYVYFELFNSKNLILPKDYLEVRIDGPNIYKSTKKEYYAYVEINIGVTSRRNKDSLAYFEHIGKAAELLDTNICVYKLGPNPQDDASLFEGLTLIDGDTMLQISHFGQIDPKEEILQGTVEAHYKMCFNK